jgi:hypothetical protein
MAAEVADTIELLNVATERLIRVQQGCEDIYIESDDELSQCKMNKLHYKGYVGDVNFTESDGMLWGKIIGISDSISFEGESVKDLVKDFQESVDEYLEFCEEVGITPQRASFTLKRD